MRLQTYFLNAVASGVVPRSFAVQCTIRAHASLERMACINAVVALIAETAGAPLQVDLDEPDLTVMCVRVPSNRLLRSPRTRSQTISPCLSRA